MGGREDACRPSLTGRVASGQSPDLSAPLFSSCQMANDTQFTCLAFPACLQGDEAGRGQCSVTESSPSSSCPRAISGTASTVTASERGPGACRLARSPALPLSGCVIWASPLTALCLAVSPVRWGDSSLPLVSGCTERAQKGLEHSRCSINGGCHYHCHPGLAVTSQYDQGTLPAWGCTQAGGRDLPSSSGRDARPVAAQPGLLLVPTSLTLIMTASFPTPLRILYQIPGGKETHRWIMLLPLTLSLRLALFWGCGQTLESGELFSGGTWGSQADRSLGKRR